MHKGAAQMHRGRSRAAWDASLQRGTHRKEARRLYVHQFRAHRAYHHAIKQGSTTASQRASRLRELGFTTWHVPCSSGLASHAGQPLMVGIDAHKTLFTNGKG
jgi:hypothetical protein